MSKPILYLDQNFASNLAKVESLPEWKDPESEFYRELLDLLRSRILGDRLACPTSSFHRHESEQGARVRDFVWRTVEELSYGLSLRAFTDILYDQIAAAARAFCKLPQPDVLPWMVAFNRDPQEPIHRLPEPPKIRVHLSSPKELVEYDWETKGIVADIYGTFKQSRTGKSRTFEDELGFQKAQTLWEIFLPAEARKSKLVGLNESLTWLGSITMTQRQSSVLEVLKLCNNTKAFWTSRELMECPFGVSFSPRRSFFDGS